MNEKPKALQIAEWFEGGHGGCELDAADELRRLYEAHDWQHKMAGDRLRRIEKLEAVNQELLEALETCVCAMQDYQAGIGITEMFDKGERMGRAAIAKAEGQA